MTRRHYRQHTPKLTALILIPLIAMAILGISYSHWQQTLFITGTVTTGKWGTEIGSCKVLYPHGYDEQMDIADQKTSNNQTLQIIIEGTTGSWYMWVGLVIPNDGMLPAQVKTPIYEYILNSMNIESCFTNTTYFYGPFNRGDFNAVWDGTQIQDLPLPESTDPPFTTPPPQIPPVTLETSQKAVIWTKIVFKTTDLTIIGQTIQIYITNVDDILI